MRILFYLGHPAHFHLFKHVVRSLEKNGDHVEVVIKAKDVLKDLLEEARWSYRQVFERGPKKNKFDFAVNLLKRDVDVYRIAKEFKPDLMLGTSAEITHVGKILGVHSIVVNEDDFDVVPWFGRLAYPLATAIMAPTVCSVGRWEKRKLRTKATMNWLICIPIILHPIPMCSSNLLLRVNGISYCDLPN